VLKASLGIGWKMGILTALASLLIPPVQVQAQTIERIGIPLYEVADLMHGSGRTFHGVIAVSGVLQCSSLRTCWFEHPTNSKQHLDIDSSQVSLRDKQHLRSCITSPCGELLVGLFVRAGREVYFKMLR
jgi:hypothetical protein